jgi:putative membrane protein
MKNTHCLLLGLALPCAFAFAASTGSTQDETFLKKAAQGGLAEVNVGQMAANKASDPNIKQFGQRMVDDHGKANDELRQIAEKENLTLPTEPSKDEQTTADKLSRLQGSKFDAEYAREMVKDHQQDVALFEKEANSGTNPELKAFAQKTLPTLKEHLQLAKQLPRGGNKSG